MNTLNEIAYSILEVVKPKASITEPITLQSIKYHIKNTRALLIRNEINKMRSVDPEIIQDLGCVSLINVDRAECCDLDIGCNFLRTTLKIPSLIELHHKPLMTRVGPIDKINRPYQLIPYERIPFEFYNKFTRSLIKAFLMNNNDYLYLAIDKDNMLSKSLTKINIQGVFEDPSDVQPFRTCGGTICFSDDSQYPVKQWMCNAIKDIVIKMYISPESTRPIDVTNNAKSDSAPQTENN